MLSMTTLTAVSVLAQEKADSGKEESKTEKAEPKEAGNLRSSLAPWVELENKVQELNSKIKSKQNNINTLIEEKNHLANNSSELKNHIKQIVKEHKELQKLVDDYEKNKNILKYRFPERNAKDNRKYDRIVVQSIEEMEQALGVDGKLNRNLKRMRTHFKTKASASPEEAKKTVSGSTIPAQDPIKAEPSIEESGSIILQK